jgi:hypothetical protein
MLLGGLGTVPPPFSPSFRETTPARCGEPCEAGEGACMQDIHCRPQDALSGRPQDALSGRPQDALSGVFFVAWDQA